MSESTDKQLIDEINEIEDRDKVFEILKTSKKAIQSEFDIVFEKLKKVNHEMSIGVLKEEILYMNGILGIMTEYLVKKCNVPDFDLEQFQMIDKLISNVKVN